jgi:hypothetical protein
MRMVRLRWFEIESQWTAQERERAGIFLTLNVRVPAETPAQADLELIGQERRLDQTGVVLV